MILTGENQHRLSFYFIGLNITILGAMFSLLFSNLLLTDQNGRIELTSDSRQMWVQVEKDP